MKCMDISMRRKWNRFYRKTQNGKISWGIEMGCRERVWREMGKLGGTLGGRCGNLGQKKLPEIYEDNPNKGVYSWRYGASKQAISWEVGLPLTGLWCIQLSSWTKRVCENPQLLRQRVALGKLTARLYYQNQHPNNSLNTPICSILFGTMSSAV